MKSKDARDAVHIRTSGPLRLECGKPFGDAIFTIGWIHRTTEEDPLREHLCSECVVERRKKEAIYR